jgi:hypothetical protein
MLCNCLTLTFGVAIERLAIDLYVTALTFTNVSYPPWSSYQAGWRMQLSY